MNGDESGNLASGYSASTVDASDPNCWRTSVLVVGGRVRDLRRVHASVELVAGDADHQLDVVQAVGPDRLRRRDRQRGAVDRRADRASGRGVEDLPAVVEQRLHGNVAQTGCDVARARAADLGRERGAVLLGLVFALHVDLQSPLAQIVLSQ